jgi:hypothetical protein
MESLAVSETDMDNRSVGGILLYIRAFSNLQGALILAERGLTGEARTLARNCFETAFYLGAVANDPTFIEKLEKNERRNKKIQAEAILGNEDARLGLDADSLQALRRYIANPENQVSSEGVINVEQAAASAKLKPLYQVYYRNLSGDGSHPTISTISRHFDAAGTTSGEVFRYGPDAPDVEDTLQCLCVVGVVLLQLATDFLPININADDLTETFSQYVSLLTS